MNAENGVTCMEKIFDEYTKLLLAMKKLISLKDMNKKIHMQIDAKDKSVSFSTTVFESHEKVSSHVREYVENGIPEVFEPHQSSLVLQENSVQFIQKIPEKEIQNFRRTYIDFVLSAEKFQNRLMSIDYPLAS